MRSDAQMDLTPPLQPVLAIAFINFIVLILILIIFFSFFARPSGFEIRMPSFATATSFEDNHVAIRITAENILYYNDKVVTINDLKRALIKISPSGTVIYVHIDRRASMGRVADVWDLCKALGISKVKIVAQDS